ncbi:MAG: hypothetical protein R3C53_06130 [Pirellulaceae bacterium]
MSYRSIKLAIIVLLTSLFAQAGYGQQDAEQYPFGNTDLFSGGIEADGKMPELPNIMPRIPAEDAGARIKIEISKLKQLEKQLHISIDRAVKDAQRLAGASAPSEKSQIQERVEQFADQLFAVEQSLTDANIRLKKYALVIEAADMTRREHEKEAINQQRVREWLSTPEPKLNPKVPVLDEQPFGNGGDPFSGS